MVCVGIGGKLKNGFTVDVKTSSTGINTVTHTHTHTHGFTNFKRRERG